MNYTDQTFDKARKLVEARNDPALTEAFHIFKHTGLLRNDEEVEAFDIWDRQQ